jgi:AbrB family transcriptional regulator (stage V sporulation protein T)
MIIAVSGAPKKEFLNKTVGPTVEKAMEERRTLKIDKPGQQKECLSCLADDEECKFTSEVIAPIISAGDPIGAVILCSREQGAKMGEMEIKLAETAAGFLAKQMAQ